MFVLEQLPPGTGERFAQFSFPYFRSLLDRPSAEVIAVGASVQGSPRGLALAQILTDRTARLHSVAVAPSSRRLGVGSALLSRMERELAGRGCTALYGVYMAGGQAAAAEALLRKCGWSTPLPRRLVGVADLARWAEVPWIADVPSGYSVEAWGDLRPSEKTSLAALAHPLSLDPFPQEPEEPQISLALRYRGVLVGWTIWTRVNDVRLRCARLFVRKDLQAMARAVPLLSHSIRRAYAAGWREAAFDVEIENQPMVRFVQRRLAPYLTSLRETRGCIKALTMWSGT